MALGFSSIQTSHLRPSCPSYFSLFRSCPRSSRSLWTSPRPQAYAAQADVGISGNPTIPFNPVHYNPERKSNDNRKAWKHEAWALRKEKVKENPYGSNISCRVNIETYTPERNEGSLHLDDKLDVKSEASFYKTSVIDDQISESFANIHEAEASPEVQSGKAHGEGNNVDKVSGYGGIDKIKVDKVNGYRRGSQNVSAYGAIDKIKVNKVNGHGRDHQNVSAYGGVDKIKVDKVNGYGQDRQNVSASGGIDNIKVKKVNGHADAAHVIQRDKSAKKPSETKAATAVNEGDLLEKLSTIYDKVLVVNSVPDAKKVVRMLTDQYRHLVHACDTEVANIEVKLETPVDHGEIICFSIYSGPDVDFGNGKSCIWVDVLDGGGKELLMEFAPFFEDPSIKKVWHNYSFDNHVIENYGIKLSGFHADTMHMARLWDSSRRLKGGYSLEALSHDPKVMSGAQLSDEKDLIGKISMKTIFGRKKVKKDGSDGKVTIIDPVEVLQREKRKPWICYSALDSISTLKLYESMKYQLSKKEWKIDGKPEPGTMFNFYEKYWRPFGELLVKMETEGMLVNRDYLAEIEKLAKAEQEIAANRFRRWASRYCPDANYMNVGSDVQLRQLLFGGIANRKDSNQFLPTEKTFRVPNIDGVIEEGKNTASKFRNITLHNIVSNLPAEIYTASGWPSVGGDALKILSGKVSSEFHFVDDDQEDVGDACETVDAEYLGAQEDRSEVDTSAYGTAFKAFEKEEKGKGKEACHAIAALCQVCSIDSLISNFILPLQSSNISGKNKRIHCSLNINTETGRLSARRPNLQNQPALEKDRYKIRQAFVAAPGNSLIVADYGQLELRILAHLSNCTSMLDAFKAGGDFHSRTAMNMYQHIRDAVESEEVLLEWDPQPGEEKPPVPLLKDNFASERRKAKMLNFSIAYGKTPVGLSRDWKVSVQEAENTVKLWYKERQEVLIWQEERKKEAIENRCVHTLLGRARQFPAVSRDKRALRGHIERAAINTPVQGSAADVAMCAMLEISKNARLNELGWRLLLQVHDEVILEGPSESAEEAKKLVVECMSFPFNGKNNLKVDLAVDAKCAQNWYAGK